MTLATVKPSGILCRKIAMKSTQPSHVETTKPGADGDAVEEGVRGQAEQHGVAALRGEEFVRVRLLAEVEVRHQRVLQQMHSAVAGEDQRRRPAAQFSLKASGSISSSAAESMKPAPSATK